MGARGTRDWLGLVGGSATLGIMSNLSTFKASSLPYAFCTLLWSELLQFHKVHFHGVEVSGGSGGGRGLGLEAIIASAFVEFINTKFVTLEEFGFLYLFFEGVWWSGHGQDHGGDLFVKTCRRVGDGREFDFKLCFGSEVLKLINIVLESIIGSSILVFAQFLEEPRYVVMGFHLGVKGVKVLIVVCHEFFKHLFFGLNGSVGHVIPFF